MAVFLLFSALILAAQSVTTYNKFFFRPNSGWKGLKLIGTLTATSMWDCHDKCAKVQCDATNFGKQAPVKGQCQLFHHLLMAVEYNGGPLPVTLANDARWQASYRVQVLDSKLKTMANMRDLKGWQYEYGVPTGGDQCKDSLAAWHRNGCCGKCSDECRGSGNDWQACVLLTCHECFDWTPLEGPKSRMGPMGNYEMKTNFFTEFAKLGRRSMYEARSMHAEDRSMYAY